MKRITVNIIRTDGTMSHWVTTETVEEIMEYILRVYVKGAGASSLGHNIQSIMFTHHDSK